MRLSVSLMKRNELRNESSLLLDQLKLLKKLERYCIIIWRGKRIAVSKQNPTKLEMEVGDLSSFIV